MGNGGSIQLDLTSPDNYVRSVAWIRDNVVLAPGQGGGTCEALKLEVKLPGGASVTLFMNRRDHYILAFQGADRVYLLGEERNRAIADFKRDLIARKFADGKKVECLSLGADHRSLGTFDIVVDPSGQKLPRQRDYSMADLESARVLARFSSVDPHMSQETIKTPLSLLVTMIAEAARHRIVLEDFLGIYRGNRPFADPSIQSWRTACQIAALSEKHFELYFRTQGVEKLAKRGAEIRALIGQIEEITGDRANRKALVQQIINGNSPHRTGPASALVDRLAHIARELKGVTQADQLTAIASATLDKDAIRAAAHGVTIPPQWR